MLFRRFSASLASFIVLATLISGCSSQDDPIEVDPVVAKAAVAKRFGDAGDPKKQAPARSSFGR